MTSDVTVPFRDRDLDGSIIDNAGAWAEAWVRVNFPFALASARDEVIEAYTDNVANAVASAWRSEKSLSHLHKLALGAAIPDIDYDHEMWKANEAEAEFDEHISTAVPNPYLA